MNLRVLAAAAAAAVVCACGQVGLPPDPCGAGGEGAGGEGAGDAECGVFEPQCPLDGTLQEGHDACADGDPTTADRCASASPCGGVCAHVPVQCDGLDSIEVQTASCDDAEECTQDRCNFYNHCSHEPVNDGLPCAGGTGQCSAGACVSGQ